ncbi:hypothetical protein [Ralstonia phage RSP15]|uniref:hypothetical protein n=1 Tax=Ralstonia phage RSP15 TaxID=1785960 RepID=UPI00074D41BF|nr:hypothetical protein BH754_gp191 [Ralstonia phage RSP15]BAU40115.1 hypothetical protein [Ralstonia phage RSP15]
MWQDHEMEDDKSRIEMQIDLGVWSMEPQEVNKAIAERIAQMRKLWKEIDILAEEARIEVRFDLKSERMPYGGTTEVVAKWNASAGMCGYL